jgi:hypothetical protein
MKKAVQNTRHNGTRTVIERCLPGGKSNDRNKFGVKMRPNVKFRCLPWKARCPVGTSLGGRGSWKGEKMQQTRKYRRFAARCLEEARGTIDPRLKAFLGEMAQEWQRLAEEKRNEKSELAVRGTAADPGD